MQYKVVKYFNIFIYLDGKNLRKSLLMNLKREINGKRIYKKNPPHCEADHLF